MSVTEQRYKAVLAIIAERRAVGQAEDGKEFFFRRNGSEDFDASQGGEKVSFEIETSPNGPRAWSVRALWAVGPRALPSSVPLLSLTQL